MFLFFLFFFFLGRREQTSATDNDDDDFLNIMNIERTKTFADNGESIKFQSHHFLEVLNYIFDFIIWFHK